MENIIGKQVLFTGKGGGFTSFSKGDVATVESFSDHESNSKMVWVTDGENRTLAEYGVEVTLLVEPQYVYLTPKQREDLKLLAVHEKSDVSKLVREAVDALIKQRRLTHLSGELAKFEGSERE